MQTNDIESLTNSVLMVIEREMRKNDLAGAFHRHADENRPMIRGMIAAIVADGLQDQKELREAS